MLYMKYKKGNRHGFPFYILYRIPIKELHTFFRNRNSNKRRIRFLTDAKVALFSGYMVVAFVVFAVVFAVVGLQMRFLFLWYRIVAVPSPWMTPQDPSCRKVQTFERTMFFECLQRIL